MEAAARSPAVFDAFAMLVSYPIEGFEGRFDAALDVIEAEAPDLAERLAPMARLLGERDPVLVEELYTRTFDLNPPCALETGYHLYGEDYDRGAFLVYLRDLLRTTGVEESGELPDHLSHVLSLLGRLEEEAAGTIARTQILPSLGKILAAFSDGDHVYREILQGAADLLAHHFGPADAVHASAFACPAPYEQGTGSVCPGMTSPFSE